ncbi:hypothetical protein ACCO45_001103 [Purpureocillium lilacinum]|uniref:Uncharacterized protein n=1 Tax=Purpureocillium lilacinum TaxID=33203 RepID=A0ACC4E628_PURLI
METGGATPRAPWDIREQHVVASAPHGSYTRNKVSHSTRWVEGSNGSDKRHRWVSPKAAAILAAALLSRIPHIPPHTQRGHECGISTIEKRIATCLLSPRQATGRAAPLLHHGPAAGTDSPDRGASTPSFSPSALTYMLGTTPGLRSQGGARLSREDHIEYLIGVAYDLPTKWVCVECATLHDFAALDFPWSSLHASCPLGWRRLSEGSAHTGSHSFMIHHRHVQIALKHKRLGASSEEHQQYVEALLAPRVTDFTPFSSRGGPNALRTRYAMIPRIIDGRFYVLGLWQYQQKQHAVSIDTMGDLNICAHSSWASFDAQGCTPRHDRVGPGGQLGISVADTGGGP